MTRGSITTTLAINAPTTGATASITSSTPVRQALFRAASMKVTVFRPSAKSCATTASSTIKPTL